MITYWVLQCANCPQLQTCMIKDPLTYTFRCRRCNKSCKFKQKNKPGLRLKHWGPFGVEHEAVSVCLGMKNGRIKW